MEEATWMYSMKALTEACPELYSASWAGHGSVMGRRTGKVGARNDGIRGEWVFGEYSIFGSRCPLGLNI